MALLHTALCPAAKVPPLPQSSPSAMWRTRNFLCAARISDKRQRVTYLRAAPKERCICHVKGWDARLVWGAERRCTLVARTCRAAHGATGDASYLREGWQQRWVVSSRPRAGPPPLAQLAKARAVSCYRIISPPHSSRRGALRAAAATRRAGPRAATPAGARSLRHRTGPLHSTALRCTALHYTALLRQASRVSLHGHHHDDGGPRRVEAGRSRAERRPGRVAGGELNAGRAQSTAGLGGARRDRCSLCPAADRHELRVASRSFAGRELARSHGGSGRFTSRATPVPTRGRGPSLAEPQAGQEASRPSPLRSAPRHRGPPRSAAPCGPLPSPRFKEPLASPSPAQLASRRPVAREGRGGAGREWVRGGKERVVKTPDCLSRTRSGEEEVLLALVQNCFLFHLEQDVAVYDGY